MVVVEGWMDEWNEMNWNDMTWTEMKSMSSFSQPFIFHAIKTDKPPRCLPCSQLHRCPSQWKRLKSWFVQPLEKWRIAAKSRKSLLLCVSKKGETVETVHLLGGVGAGDSGYSRAQVRPIRDTFIHWWYKTKLVKHTPQIACYDYVMSSRCATVGCLIAVGDVWWDKSWSGEAEQKDRKQEVEEDNDNWKVIFLCDQLLLILKTADLQLELKL